MVVTDIPEEEPVQAVDMSALLRREQEDDTQSLATTQLASDINSVVANPKACFLNSITFQRYTRIAAEKDEEGEGESGDEKEEELSIEELPIEWGIQLTDVAGAMKKKLFRSTKNATNVTITGASGIILRSGIQVGDTLKYVNSKRIGVSFSADLAQLYLQKCWDEQNWLSIATQNPSGSDILVKATVMKPRPTMTYEEMGLKVWFWGGLCIKEIADTSLWKHSVLRPTDHIVTINNIVCESAKPAQFAQVINSLPEEVTIIVKRGKQRWSGKFG